MFFLIECIQIRFAGTNYLKESFWNIFEISQLGLFIAFLILRSINEYSQETNFMEIILQLLLIIAGFLKVQYFLRVYEDYGFLV